MQFLKCKGNCDFNPDVHISYNSARTGYLCCVPGYLINTWTGYIYYPVAPLPSTEECCYSCEFDVIYNIYQAFSVNLHTN